MYILASQAATINTDRAGELDSIFADYGNDNPQPRDGDSAGKGKGKAWTVVNSLGPRDPETGGGSGATI
ncbi:hypothetical protein LTR37_006354 [Vermiconidia calcicola]|uniref:Uncharacterized protein n=1 Tax=Vermiconidia calcicola TaxID=1690605 RepID=A0ACC3NI09_9PEZI|nr:hypothetical protein LTR37_006354 [Vermiconidia calcicola]